MTIFLTKVKHHGACKQACSKHRFCHGSGATGFGRFHATLPSQMASTLTTAASALPHSRSTSPCVRDFKLHSRGRADKTTE
ncbi:hypothetical protein HF086_006471, partial [Spodoptera exigua]